MFIANFFQPIDRFAIKRLLNGDMRHRGFLCCAVPVFFAWREPDDIARMNFLNWAALALRPTAPRGNEEGLAERMCVPSGAGAGFKGNTGASHSRRSACLQKWIDAYCPCKPIGRTFSGGLCANSFDFHIEFF